MAFDARELSNTAGAPIVLYEFTRGGMAWRYCTADRDVSWGGHVWAAVAIADRGFRSSGRADNDTFDVAMPATEEVPLLYHHTPPSERVWLKARRVHQGDDDGAVFWSGSVAQVTREDEATAIVSCQSLASAFGANGLRLGWQRTCPYMLYDHDCGVNKEGYGVLTSVVALDGRAVQVSSVGGHPDGWFSGGFIEWSVGGGATERRLIEAHAGLLFTLLNGTYGLAPGTTLIAYPGCDRTVDECDLKFDNLPRFGGYPHLPGKSPFDGTMVF